MTLTFPNRSFFKPFILAGLISLFSISAFSQNNTGYNLLWEISGKGLKKPSYLFGSMHLKDRRLFNFSDSVMLALSSCSTFALEVHPDTMINAMVASVSEGKDFKSLLKHDYAKPDDMQTFTDAYLYGIARTFRKKIIGLEPIQNQLDLLDSWQERFSQISGDDEEKERALVEEMISIYSRGNLNEILVFMMKMDADVANVAERNQVMAKKIAGVIGTESLFATVGAAHMPGEDGVIALLQKAGYTLRPVKATFTGVAAKYKIDHSKMEWSVYTDSVNAFQLSFPSKPFEIKAANGLKTVGCADLTNEAAYGVVAAFSGPVGSKGTKFYLDSLLQNYLSSDSMTVLQRTELTKNGVPALDVVIKKSKRFMRMQLFHKNNTIYMLLIDNELNNVKEAYADIFLNSFKSITVPVWKSAWSKYTNELGAFSILMPGQPEYVKNEVPNQNAPDHPNAIHLYVGVDKVNQAVYVARYNDFALGMYLADRNAVLDQLVQESGAKGRMVGQVRTIYKDGYEGRAVDVVVKEQLIELRMYVKGNRVYMLLRQNLLGPVPLKVNDGFFDSFTFEQTVQKPSVTATIDRISVTSPEPLILISDDSKDGDKDSFLWNTKNYASRNNHTGGVYNLECAELSPYYRNLNVDSLYLNVLKKMSSVNDSIYKTEDSMIGSVKGKQVMAFNKQANTASRTRIWIDGNQFYIQSAIADQKEIEGKAVLDFFDKVKSNSTGTFDIRASKSALIMKDLGSADTSIAKSALAALNYYEFDKTELSLIYAALKKKYKDDAVEGGKRSKLMSELVRLNDAKTVEVLKEIYNDRTNADELRADALSTVPRVDKSHINWYMKSLIEGKQLNVADARFLFRPLRDSLELVPVHIDGMYKLLDQPAYHQEMLYLFKDLMDKSVRNQYLPILEQRRSTWENLVVKDMDEALTKANDRENLNFQLIYTYLEMMPVLKLNKLTDDYTKRVFAVDSVTYLHTAALAARILSGLTLDPKMLAMKLDSLDSRMEIMRAFNDAGRLQEVPVKYKVHKEFAKLCFYEYLVEDADEPTGLVLLGQFEKSDQVFYVFEFSYPNDEGELKTYIGVCGGFDAKKEGLSFDEYECFTDYNLKTENWLEDAKALIADENDKIAE